MSPLSSQIKEEAANSSGPQAERPRGPNDRANKKKSGPSPSTLRHAVKKAEERMAQLTAEIARIDDDMANASVSNPKTLEGLTRRGRRRRLIWTPRNRRGWRRRKPWRR